MYGRLIAAQNEVPKNSSKWRHSEDTLADSAHSRRWNGGTTKYDTGPNYTPVNRTLENYQPKPSSPPKPLTVGNTRASMDRMKRARALDKTSKAVSDLHNIKETYGPDISDRKKLEDSIYSNRGHWKFRQRFRARQASIKAAQIERSFDPIKNVPLLNGEGKVILDDDGKPILAGKAEIARDSLGNAILDNEGVHIILPRTWEKPSPTKIYIQVKVAGIKARLKAYQDSWK
jgi:hypothetical protein